MSKKWLLVLLGVFLVLGAACGGDDEGSDASNGTEPGTEASEDEETDGGNGSAGGLTITGVDFAFEAPASVPAGETEITFENEGTEPHQLILFLLSEDAPDMKELIELPETKAESFLEKQISDAADTIRPGESTTFTTKLEPGRYGMGCFIDSETKKQPHSSLGMVDQVTVE